MTYPGLLIDLIGAEVRKILAERARNSTIVTCMGTVAQVDAAMLQALVVCDGSEQAAPMRWFGHIPPPAQGDRVGAIKYGPHWVITGSYSTTAPRGLMDAMVSTEATVAGSTGTEDAVESINWSTSEPTYTFVPGRLYAVHIAGGIHDNGNGNAHVATVRLRKGAETTTGTQLGFVKVGYPAGMGGNVLDFTATRYVKNSGAAEVATKLSLSIARNAGPGTISLYGDAQIPLTVTPSDAGSIARNPGWAAVAVSV